MYLTTLVLVVTLGINYVLSVSLNDHRLRVAHGKNANVEEFPHLVSVIDMHGFFGMSFCGGSIISPKVVLTAGHCFNDQTDTSSDLIRAGKFGTQHYVRKVVVHPSYDKKILLLANPIEIDNATTKVIPMFESGEESKPGTRAVLAGWGQTSPSSDISDVLQSLDMRIVDKDECRKSWNGGILRKIIGFVYKLITGEEALTLEDQICASSLSGDQRASLCQGDSGGPLVIDGRVAGIASFATKNCQSEPPNVFTEVAYYRDWIDMGVAELESIDY